MLIFNGKKYFVPFIGKEKIEGADATPDQVVEGVKFAGANGIVEEGSLKKRNGIDFDALDASVHFEDRDYAYFRENIPVPRYVEGNFDVKVPLSQLGDVRPMWVAEGYTFTSEAGVSVNGECPIYIPNKVEPILCYSCTDTDPRFFLFTSETTTPLMIEDIIDFKVEKSEFGNATAANVRSGVRFTSAEGVNEEGRMPTLALLKPKIYVSPDGEITATVTQDFDGFVEEGEQSATEWLKTKGAAVIVPSNKTQTAVSKGWFTTGDVTVAPIPDKYKDATGANALPSQVVKGAYFLGADGVVKEGTREDSCTLVFVVDGYGDLYVAYTKSDGTAHFDTLPPNVDTTIEGIMCGSVITMYSQQGSYFSPNGLPITQLGTLGSCNLYSAPTESGTYRLPFDRS